MVVVAVEERLEDTLLVGVLVLDPEPVDVVDPEPVRVPSSDRVDVPEKVSLEDDELERVAHIVAEVDTDAVDVGLSLGDAVELCVGRTVLDTELVLVLDFVSVFLPDVDGCAVRVRELVVECVVVGEAEADLDLAPVGVLVGVARVVGLEEELAVGDRETVIVFVENPLEVDVRVGAVVQDTVALVVEVLVG